MRRDSSGWYYVINGEKDYGENVPEIDLHIPSAIWYRIVNGDIVLEEVLAETGIIYTANIAHLQSQYDAGKADCFPVYGEVVNVSLSARMMAIKDELSGATKNIYTDVAYLYDMVEGDEITLRDMQGKYVLAAADINGEATFVAVVENEAGDVITIGGEVEIEIEDMLNAAPPPSEHSAWADNGDLFGVVTDQGMDSGGWYYTINGEQVYSARVSALDSNTPTAIWYKIVDGAIVVERVLAETGDPKTVNLLYLQNQYDIGNLDYYPVYGELIKYNFTPDAMTITDTISGSYQKIFVNNAFRYNMLERDDIIIDKDIFCKCVLALVDSDGNALFAAVASDIAGGAIGGGGYGAAIYNKNGSVMVSGGKVASSGQFSRTISTVKGYISVSGDARVEATGDVGTAIYSENDIFAFHLGGDNILSWNTAVIITGGTISSINGAVIIAEGINVDSGSPVTITNAGGGTAILLNNNQPVLVSRFEKND
jgi:hypothetical protein